MSDKRGAARQKSLLRGFVYFGNSPSAVECIVRDISETGARLKFQNLPIIADALDLHIPAKGHTLHADVKWYQRDEIGVAFVKASALGDPCAVDGELSERVKRLEVEIAALKQLVRRLQQNSGSKSEAA